MAAQEDDSSSSDSDDGYGPQIPVSQDAGQSNDTVTPNAAVDTIKPINADKLAQGVNLKKRKREDMEQSSNSLDSSEPPNGTVAVVGDEELCSPDAKRVKVADVRDVDLERLPSSEWYEYSWMHKKTVTQIVMAPQYDFLITTSIDGVIKFWKKIETGIEFVKEYHPHDGYIQCLDVSPDGTLLITIGNDRQCCIFDVVTFDMITMMRLDYRAGTVCWLNSKSKHSGQRVAISKKNSHEIRIYKPTLSGDKVLEEVFNVHFSSILCMRYNEAYGCCISSSVTGNVQMWSTESPYEQPPELQFEYVMGTDYVIYRKEKAIPVSITVSHNGQWVAIKSDDHFVRVFRFKSGKLVLSLDESIERNEAQQKSGALQVDSIEFGKHVAVERQLMRGVKEHVADRRWLRGNVLFDESDRYIVYGTMMGIKMVCIEGGASRLIGREESPRFVNLALFQGTANVLLGHSRAQKLGINAIIGQGAEDEVVAKIEDPCIFATGFGRDRFYLFSNRANEGDDHRDIQNERPTKMASKIASQATHRTLGSKAVIRTTFGDIYIKLFAAECPKTVENFTVHSINNYFNELIFHRVIRGFMIQTGDPQGDSKGGQSIWGGVFDDEFHRSLKHDRPGTVSMANAGPNTNGSQFFITTTEAKWLDGKHTIFGRVTKGMDVVQAIESVKVDRRSKKPVEPIKIINITVDKI